MKRIYITPRTFIAGAFFVLFLANTTLFLLRSYTEDWWFGDYSVYAEASQLEHLKSYLSFIFIFGLFFGVAFFLVGRCSVYLQRKKLRLSFAFVVFLIISQIIAAVYFSVGVASSTGAVANPIFYLFFIFSFDAFYYVYAVIEEKRSRLFFATILYVASNIVRGWAGFFIPLAIIYFARKRFVTLKALTSFSLFIVSMVPLLLIMRDFFRGGTSYFSILADQGFSGMSLLNEYFSHVMKSVLVRLDFYSNYIGVQWMTDANYNFNSICAPFEENVLRKILNVIGISNECIALGSALPSFLYEFFVGKGTSFSVASGFMALPSKLALIYGLSYFLVLVLTGFFVRFFVRAVELKLVFSFMLVFLLFQGWMYQFLYNFMGFVLAFIVVNCKVKYLASPHYTNIGSN